MWRGFWSGAVSRADIKPSKYIPFWWCVLPPAPDKLYSLYKLGARVTSL